MKEIDFLNEIERRLQRLQHDIEQEYRKLSEGE